MESRIERVQNFLDNSVQQTENFEDQKAKVESDMIAGIQESISLGWLTPEQGDEMIRGWQERYGNVEKP